MPQLMVPTLMTASPAASIIDHCRLPNWRRFFADENCSSVSLPLPATPSPSRRLPASHRYVRRAAASPRISPDLQGRYGSEGRKLCVLSDGRRIDGEPHLDPLASPARRPSDDLANPEFCRERGHSPESNICSCFARTACPQSLGPVELSTAGRSVPLRQMCRSAAAHAAALSVLFSLTPL